MKLKKIASLMLAGIMAVSMLAACGDKAASSTPTQPEEPVDTSFATAVNAELSTAAKNTLSFGSDSKLASVLDVVADKISSHTLATSVSSNDGFVIGSDAEDFRHLLGINRNNSLTTWFVDNNPSSLKFATPFTSKVYAYGSKDGTGYNTWSFFKNDTASSTTVADLIVVSGALTEEGLAEVVASAANQLIGETRLPLSGEHDGTKYRYAYTGNVAVTKVDNLSGDVTAYVIGMTITQTPTPVKNG